MSKLAKALTAAAGNAAGESLYVEDVFSTYLYTGNSSTQTITNGIDLAGEGGLVWIKPRNQPQDHILFDTERGVTKSLTSNSSAAEYTATQSNEGLSSFNSDGFALKLYQNNTGINNSAVNAASWTFRKAKKFFDVVTYTGNGVAGREIAHNLGSTPACIIVKSTNNAVGWAVYHSSLGATKYLTLNLTDEAITNPNYWNDTEPTSTNFTVAGTFPTNRSGYNYVAYLFAHTPTSNFVQESFSASYFADGVSPVSVNGPDGAGEYVMYTNTSIGNTYAKIAGVFYSVSGTNNWDGISDVIFAATGSRYKQGAYEYTNGGIAPHYQVDYYTQYSGPFYEDEESFIVCGSVSYSGGATVDLGFEPQWVLIKTSSATGNWVINDNMRGMPNGSRGPRLDADTSNAEFANATVVYPTATGFIMPSGLYDPVDLIYIAIRRPMKTPESGTEVYMPDKDRQTSSSSVPNYYSGFPVDLGLIKYYTYATNWSLNTRLLGTTALIPNSTAAETTDNDSKFDYMDGFGEAGNASTDFTGWSFKRATGFFDVVAWTGTGSYAVRNHNLGAVPELVIQKARTSLAGGNDWFVNTATQYGYLNLTNSFATFGRSLTSTTFQPVADGNVNWITYLFATLAGVSKVGSYTGTGNNINVDCGFSAGARFILIKRTDSTGDWYVWDSARGIVADNDPYLLLNSTAAEVTSTDYIDPLSSGFTVTSSAPAALNASGGTYLFMAIS